MTAQQLLKRLEIPTPENFTGTFKDWVGYPGAKEAYYEELEADHEDDV